MNYINTTLVDLSAFLHLPDAPALDEKEMAARAQAAGYAQPGLKEGIPQDILDAVLALGQSGTNFAEPFNFNNFVSTLAFSAWQN